MHLFKCTSACCLLEIEVFEVYFLVCSLQYDASSFKMEIIKHTMLKVQSAQGLIEKSFPHVAVLKNQHWIQINMQPFEDF